MLERYLVRYFLAVADHGSFSRAAQSCRVSQPTLSVGIAKLEALLEAPLFVRTNRQVRLTAAGSRFLAHARRIESEFNLAQSSQERDEPVPVRLGVLNSISGSELAQIARTTIATAPRDQFELVPGSARELNAQLSRGRIDAALTIMAGAGSRFRERPLRPEGYALALPAAHPLATFEAATAEDVANDVMIVRRHCEALPLISRHFTARGIRPHFALRASNDERVLQMIAAGLGITVMPASYAMEGVRMVRLIGLDLQRTLGLAYAPEAERLADAPPPLLTAAIEVIGGG